MGHTAQTRRMANAGKKTGVSSRRSLKPRGAFGDSLRATRSPNPFDLKPEVREGLNKRIKGTEQFWNDLSHQWFGSNPKSFPYNMSKWDAPAPDKSPRPKFIQGGWPEYAEWAEGEEQRDKNAWPSRNAKSLVTKQSQDLPSEPKKDMGDRESYIWRKVIEGELTDKEGRALIKEIKN